MSINRQRGAKKVVLTPRTDRVEKMKTTLQYCSSKDFIHFLKDRELQIDLYF